MFVVVVLAVLSSCYAATDSNGSNERDFYIILEGLGPTGGSSMNSPDTLWARTLVWQDYLGVSSQWDTTLEAIKEVRNKLNWSVYTTVVGSKARQKRRQKHQTPKQPTPNISHTVETLISAGIKPDEINLEYICEDDSGGTGYAPDILTMARQAGYTNGNTRMTPEAAFQGWKSYAEAAFHDTIGYLGSAKGANLFARPGFPSSVHALLDYANTLLVERVNDDVGSLPTALSFLRGACAQENSKQQARIGGKNAKSWGIDLSLWWGVIDGCVTNLPASLHRRVLFLSYFAGAKIVTVEGCGYIDPHTQRPFPLLQEVDAFGTFVKKQVPPSHRGLHDSTVAVVLSEHNGYSERPAWKRGGQGTTLWNYANIPGYAEPGSGAVDGFFSTAFPGVDGTVGFRAFPFGEFSNNVNPPPSVFARSSISTTYAPNPDDAWATSSGLPFGKFKNRTEAYDWFQGGQTGQVQDPSPFRPMADSRWGDIIDVFVDKGEDLQYSNFESYKIIIWLSSDGAINATVRGRLEAFAEDGGTVIVSAGSVGMNEAKTFSGVSFTGNFFTCRAWHFMNDPEAHVEMLNVAEVEDFYGSQVVVQSLPEKRPIVVKRALGKGAIYTSLVPWFLNGKGLSSVATEVFDRVISPSQPIKIKEGLPCLFWTSTTHVSVNNGVNRFVALANNAGGGWVGKIESHMPSKCQAFACKDLLSGKELQCSRQENDDGYADITFSAGTIAEQDVLIVQISCQ